MNLPARLGQNGSARRLEIDAELTPVLGAAAVHRLMRAFHGRTLYIPATIGPNHPIAVAIGRDNAAVLAAHCAGSHIDIPVSIAKRARILELKATGLANHQIALEMFCTTRFVRKVLAESDEPHPDLFG